MFEVTAMHARQHCLIQGHGISIATKHLIKPNLSVTIIIFNRLIFCQECLEWHILQWLQRNRNA